MAHNGKIIVSNCGNIIFAPQPDEKLLVMLAKFLFFFFIDA
jgi:hypothetical protein